MYINTYMWNLEKWYRSTYLQGRNRDVDIENGHVDTVGEGDGGTNWEIGIDIYILPCVKYIASRNMLLRTCYKAQEAQLSAL